MAAPFLVVLAGLLGLALCGRLQAGRGMYAVCWVGAFAGLAWAARRFPGGRRPTAMAAVLAAGLVLRLLFVWAWPADSDINRYIVEGAVQAAHGNPYRIAPEDPKMAALLPEAARPALAGVNHKELSAAYPPLAELYCRLVATFSPTPLAFKAAAALADMLTCLILAALLIRTGAPAALLLLCAVSPLSLAMAAGEGHLDAMAACLIALGLFCFTARRDGLGFFLLGAAAMVKYPALVLVPFFMSAANARKAWLALLPLALFGCYLDAGGRFFASLAAFAGALSHGGPVVALLQPLLGRFAPWVSLAGGGLVLGVLWLTVQDRRRGPVLAMTVVLACLPTVYPWYFLGLIPLWLARPGWSYGWLLAAQGWVTAPTWLRASGLGGEGAALGAAWLPFVALAIIGWFRPLLLVAGRRWVAPRTLSVVTPTRNEADRLGACLAALAGAVAAGQVRDIVVADGGSHDATVAVATAHGARVVVAGGGRGGQIAAGIAASRGEAVLIVHADTVCRPEVPGRILRLLAENPFAVGGAVGMGFSGGGAGLGLIAALNTLRARMTGIAFGDQGQFFRREALADSGGFPDLALMEDVELALRLREAGETAFLGGGLTVSDRRWAGKGFGGKVADVLALFVAYLAGRRLGLGDPTGRRFYRRYYGRPPHQTAV